MRVKQTSLAENKVTTRDEWLLAVASAMKPWFADLDFPMPEFEIKSGFPSTGSRGGNTAETWVQEEDASFVIFVRPDRSDPVEVAGAIAHQMCKIACGAKDTHGHLFRHLAISIGLKGRKTEAKPGRLFLELSDPILKQVGDLPSAEMTPTSSQPSVKQTTRQIKVSCQKCGYVARVSRKWIDQVGPPHCPLHGAMKPDL